MIETVEILSMTPDGVISKKGVEMQVVITYTKGQGNTRRFSFFVHQGYKSEQIFYSFPTEINGLTEDLTSQQVVDLIENIRDLDPPHHTFQAFLGVIGSPYICEKILDSFKEWAEKFENELGN